MNGIDPVIGPTSHDEREAAVNALMASRAANAVLVADSSKIDKRAFAAIGSGRLFSTLITDSGVTRDQLARLADRGYDVIVPSELFHRRPLRTARQRVRHRSRLVGAIRGDQSRRAASATPGANRSRPRPR